MNDSNDLCSEKDFQLLKEYASSKLEKVRHDNVLNDTLQMDEDHDNVLDDSIQIVEDIMTGRHDDILNDTIQIDEDLSQSLLAKSRRRKSSLYEATQAFISVSNNTIIETSIDSQNLPQLESIHAFE